MRPKPGSVLLLEHLVKEQVLRICALQGTDSVTGSSGRDYNYRRMRKYTVSATPSCTSLSGWDHHFVEVDRRHGYAAPEGEAAKVIINQTPAVLHVVACNNDKRLNYFELK